MLGGALGQFPLGGGPTETVSAVFIDWFSPLSDPVRIRQGLRPEEQQSLALHPNPIVSFGWFENLSEPVRVKRGLRPDEQQFLAGDTEVIPLTRAFWFAPLSEPVRIKPGLHAARQQFLASPSRLLPTPTLFGALDATETKDTMLAGATFWNRIENTEIGVINTTPQPAEIAVSPAAPSVGTITVKISITMPR